MLKKIISTIKNFKLRYKIATLFILVALIGGGIWFFQKNQQAASPTFQTTPVTKGTIINSLTLSGQVQSSNLISVMTKASGVVSKVYITDGQSVKSGDKIAEITLDSEGKNSQSEAWSSYLSAKNNLESAKIKEWSLESSMWSAHEKFEKDALDTDLSVDDPIYIQTNRDWLAAEATYKNQQQSVIQAQAAVTQAWNNYQLYQSTITASVNGTIVGLNLAEGLSLSYSEGSSGNASNQTVATLKTEGSPVALFQVTEVDINTVHVGQEVTLTLDSITGKTFTGEVAAVDRVGSETSGVTQYPVLIKFNEDDPAILTNMAVNAEIVFESKENALIVPLTAISTMGGRSMVSVMKDGKIQPISVEVGIENDTEAEIVSGLSEGDEIISGTQSSTTTTSTQQGGSLFGGGMGGGIPGGGQVRGTFTTISRPRE